MYLRTKNKDQELNLGLYLVRETGLEPVHQRYTPLKRARLPIPPLPQNLKYYTTKNVVCQAFFCKKIKKYFQMFFVGSL